MARDFTESGTDKLDCGDSLNPTSGSFTMCVWFNNKAQSTNNRSVVANRNGSTGYMLRINANETLDWFVYMGGSLQSLNTGTTALTPTNDWFFIVADFVDGTTAEANLYLNGSAEGTPLSGNFGSYNASAVNALIGNDAAGGSLSADGRYGFVLFYDAQLTSNERDAAQMGRIPRPNDLLAAYRISGNGSTENDLSGNGHTATATGTTLYAPNPPIAMASRWELATHPFLEFPAGGEPTAGEVSVVPHIAYDIPSYSVIAY